MMASNRLVAHVVLTHAVVLLLTTSKAAIIGMNCGRVAHQKLLPSMAVDLLLQNNITAAKIFTSEIDVLKAFVNSGIHLTVGISSYTAIRSLGHAIQWVQQKGKYFKPCNVRSLYIGNGMFVDGKVEEGSMQAAINALEWLSDAVKHSGYGEDITMTIALDQSCLKPNISKPSEGDFLEPYKGYIVRITDLLKANKSPFVVELYPISYVRENNFPSDFAFMDNSIFSVTDVEGKVYRNAVEFLHDSFLWALRKINASELKIVIGSIGWPTDGYPGANPANAERFYRSLLPWVPQDRGTPMHRGGIDIYLSSLTDENKRKYVYPFSRNLGIYTSYGQPKYKIDLSGQGRGIYPTTARGIKKMPERWCVLDEKSNDVAKIGTQFAFACAASDCTSLAPGGSCSHLTFRENASYAFNKYFQFNFQKEEFCNFRGLGKVVTDNPSVGGCKFAVEVVSRLPVTASTGRLHLGMPQYTIIYCLFLLTFLVIDVVIDLLE